MDSTRLIFMAYGTIAFLAGYLSCWFFGPPIKKRLDDEEIDPYDFSQGK